MTTNPKRPWFRFHLLTLVLMMLAIGGLMWANSGNIAVADELREGLVYESDTPYYFGWPMMAAVKAHEFYNRKDKRLIPEGDLRILFFGGGILVDAGVALVILFAVALISESLIRRREGRKP